MTDETLTPSSGRGNPDTSVAADVLGATELTGEGTEAGHEAPAGRVKPWEAFKIRQFRYLWFNSFSFSMIQATQRFAFVWLMLSLYDRAEEAGRIALVLGIPSFLGLSMVGGWSADQFDRRNVMLVTQGMAALVTATVSTLLFLDALSYSMTFVLAFLLGVTLAVGSPVRISTIPTVVPRHTLMNAIVLNGFAQNISQIVGPAVGGFVISAWGVKGAFAMATALYLFGMAAILPLRIPPRETEMEALRPADGLGGIFAKVKRDLAAGFKFIGGHAGIRGLFLFLAIAAIFLVGPFNVLVPQIARVKLDRQVVEASLMFTAMGTGTLVSTMIQASLGDIKRKGLAFLVVCSSCGIMLAIVGQSTSYALTIGLMFFWGIIGGFFMNLIQTLIQSNTPHDYLGRVASVQTWTMQGLTPIGALVAGWGADTMGLTRWLLITGIALVASAVIVSVTQPAFRRM